MSLLPSGHIPATGFSLVPSKLHITIFFKFLLNKTILQSKRWPFYMVSKNNKIFEVRIIKIETKWCVCYQTLLEIAVSIKVCVLWSRFCKNNQSVLKMRWTLDQVICARFAGCSRRPWWHATEKMWPSAHLNLVSGTCMQRTCTIKIPATWHK